MFCHEFLTYSHNHLCLHYTVIERGSSGVYYETITISDVTQQWIKFYFYLHLTDFHYPVCVLLFFLRPKGISYTIDGIEK